MGWLVTVVALDFNLDKVRYGNQQFAFHVTLLGVYPKLQSRWHKTKHSINTKYTNTHTHTTTCSLLFSSG